MCYAMLCVQEGGKTVREYREELREILFALAVVGGLFFVVRMVAFFLFLLTW